MAIILNQAAVDRAESLIKAGEVDTFDADWNEEKPTPDEVDYFTNTHYMDEYGLWFLGINDQFDSSVKEHYEYPHGDLKMVQRSALICSQKEAEKNGHKEIAAAAKKLLEMIDKK